MNEPVYSVPLRCPGNSARSLFGARLRAFRRAFAVLLNRVSIRVSPPFAARDRLELPQRPDAIGRRRLAAIARAS